VRPEGLGKLKKCIHPIGSQTRDPPACSIVPQPICYRVLPPSPLYFHCRLRLCSLGTPATTGPIHCRRPGYMNAEQLVKWEVARETKALGQNPTHCHLPHPRTQIHKTEPGFYPRAASVGSRRLTVWATARSVESRLLEPSSSNQSTTFIKLFPTYWRHSFPSVQKCE
jgi:hypothetical protein